MRPPPAGSDLPLVKCVCCRCRNAIRRVSRSDLNPGRIYFKCPNHRVSSTLRPVLIDYILCVMLICLWIRFTIWQGRGEEYSGSCDYFFWIEDYVEMLLANGVEVEAAELENIALIVKKANMEMKPHTAAALAGLAWSPTNTSTKSDHVVAVRKERHKGTEIAQLNVLVSIARMILCVCVLLLGVNLYAAMKISRMY